MSGSIPILGLLMMVLWRRLLFKPSTISSRLPVGQRLLPALLIDVYLKLTEFQPRLRQILLKLILSHEQECAKIVSIGGELCMHRLIRHGDPHAEWARVMRWKFQMDSLSLSRCRSDIFDMRLPKRCLRRLELIYRWRQSRDSLSIYRRLCLPR